MRRRVGERIISACVVPTVKQGGRGVMVWGNLLVTPSVIYLEFKAHNSIATTAFCSDTPLRYAVCALWDYHWFFNRTMTQHTSRLCKYYLTKKESDGVLHQMTWPPQSPDINPIEMVWYELDSRIKEKCSAYLTPSRLLEKHSR